MLQTQRAGSSHLRQCRSTSSPCFTSPHPSPKLPKQWHLHAVQRPEQQQRPYGRQQQIQQEIQQQSQQQTAQEDSLDDDFEQPAYIPPPGRRYTQLWKAKRPGRKPRLLDAPQDPHDPLWGTTKAQRKAALQQQLQAQYGPHAGHRDVRLYLKKRALNQARPRGTRRGGMPLDDSFDKPGTFLKLSADFQRTVVLERVEALVSTFPRLSPESIWHLYTTIPGLLTFPTMTVAQRLTGLANATGLSLQDTASYCCTFRPLAFVHPDTVLSRVALLAKVARLERGAAVRLMQQQPVLWLISSRLLAPRVEQLSLLLRCCPITSLRLIGTCTDLLGIPLASLQQQLTAVCSIMGVEGQPNRVVPLLLWQPALLWHQQASLLQQHNSPNLQLQQQQLQEEEEEEEEEEEAEETAAVPVPGLDQQLQQLGTALGLRLSSVQVMTLRCPDLLQMTGLAAAAAAVERLSSSWLLMPDAVQQRQQYQQQLLHTLQPGRYSNVAKKRKLRQGQGLEAAGWYQAAQAAEAAVLSCQWWDKPQREPPPPQQQQRLEQQGQGQDQGQGQENFLSLQQLVLQAPALLVLAAARGAQSGVDFTPGGPAAAAAAKAVAPSAGVSSHTEQDTKGLSGRLHSVCEHVEQLLHDWDHHQHQQQQQQQTQVGQQAMQPMAGQQQRRQQQHKQQQQGQLRAHQPHKQQHRQPQQQWRQLLYDIQQAAVLEPCILSQPPGWVVAQLQQLSAALQVSPNSMLSLWLQHPSILWLTQGQVFEQVRVLCGVLRLPAQQVKQLLTQPDAVLLLHVRPEALRKGFITAAKAAGGEGVLRGVLRQQPALLLPGWQGELYRRTVKSTK